MFAAREQSGKDVEVVRGEQAPGTLTSRLRCFQRVRTRRLGCLDRRSPGKLSCANEIAEMVIAGQSPQMFQANSGERGNFLLGKDLLTGSYS